MTPLFYYSYDLRFIKLLSVLFIKFKYLPLTMPSNKKIFEAILKDITPTEQDSTIRKVTEFLKSAENEAKKLKIKAKPFLGGSFAKNTWLKGDYDVDVFFAFDLKYKTKNLSEMLEKILVKFNPARIHGSRDYFQIKDGICFEVIPVLNIKKAKDADNVTDFSLRHVNWVNKHSKKLKNDIRLAKKFCKAQRVYGAESYIRGFSGHVLDILIIHYGGFAKLIKAAPKWTPKVIIDTENHYKGKALQFINKSKTESPLVVVDPVQPGRNAAAAISQQQFDKFVEAAKKFAKKPLLDFFEQKKIDVSALKKQGALLKVSIIPPEGVENVVGVKLLKAGEFLKKKLDDFNVVFSEWTWDKKSPATWHFVVKKNQLSKEITVEGPPLKFKEHCDKFKKAHKKVFAKKNRLFAVVEREFLTPRDALIEAFKNNYLKDKAKSIVLV